MIMKTPDNFLPSSSAGREWGITKMRISQKRDEFRDDEIIETPLGTLFSREGMQRVFGEPRPGRVAPNSKRARLERGAENEQNERA
jgi:hypothetical protein